MKSSECDTDTKTTTATTKKVTLTGVQQQQRALVKIIDWHKNVDSAFGGS